MANVPSTTQATNNGKKNDKAEAPKAPEATTAPAPAPKAEEPPPAPRALVNSVMVQRDQLVVNHKINSRNYAGHPVDAFLKQNAAAIDDLAENIRLNGLLQPVDAVKGPNGKLILIAGFRRVAALDKLGHKQVPVIILDHVKADDEFALIQTNLIENVQRDDLTAAEIGVALSRMKRAAKERGETLSDAQIGAMVSKSRADVSNSIRAAEKLIPEFLRAWKGEGGIVLTNAKAYAMAALDPDRQRELYNEMVEAHKAGSGEGKDEKEGGKEKDSKPRMARREKVEEVLRLFRSSKAREAEVEFLKIGGNKVPVAKVSEETLKFTKSILEWVLGGAKEPPIGYKQEEEVEEGEDE